MRLVLQLATARTAWHRARVRLARVQLHVSQQLV